MYDDLNELYKSQKWVKFGILFDEYYSKASTSEQLNMLRVLLCEWRDQRAMEIVIELSISGAKVDTKVY